MTAHEYVEPKFIKWFIIISLTTISRLSVFSIASVLNASVKKNLRCREKEYNRKQHFVYLYHDYHLNLVLNSIIKNFFLIYFYY